MKQRAHFLLLLASVPFLLLSFLSIGLFALLAMLADRAHPTARFGNCWTFAVARWARYGGYVSLRPSEGITLFGLPIPHAIWQSALGGPLRMTSPIHRKHGIAPWFALLFRYEVWCGDAPRQHRYVESEPPAAWMPTEPPRI